METLYCDNQMTECDDRSSVGIIKGRYAGCFLEFDSWGYRPEVRESVGEGSRGGAPVDHGCLAEI